MICPFFTVRYKPADLNYYTIYILLYIWQRKKLAYNYGKEMTWCGPFLEWHFYIIRNSVSTIISTYGPSKWISIEFSSFRTTHIKRHQKFYFDVNLWVIHIYSQIVSFLYTTQNQCIAFCMAYNNKRKKTRTVFVAVIYSIM